MQVVSERTTVPVPKVFRHDLDLANDVGIPYMFLEAMPAHPMGCSYDKVLSPFLQNFLTQFAEYVVQLGSIAYPTLSTITCGDAVLTYDNSTEHFEAS